MDINGLKKDQKDIMERLEKHQQKCDSEIKSHIERLENVNIGEYSRWVEDYFEVKARVRHPETAQNVKRGDDLVEPIYEVLKKELNLMKNEIKITKTSNAQCGDILIEKNNKEIFIEVKTYCQNKDWAKQIRDCRKKNPDTYFLVIEGLGTSGPAYEEMEKGFKDWIFLKYNHFATKKQKEEMKDWIDLFVKRINEVIKS